jgi:hypothetical protein
MHGQRASPLVTPGNAGEFSGPGCKFCPNRTGRRRLASSREVGQVSARPIQRIEANGGGNGDVRCRRRRVEHFSGESPTSQDRQRSCAFDVGSLNTRLDTQAGSADSSNQHRAESSQRGGRPTINEHETGLSFAQLRAVNLLAWAETDGSDTADRESEAMAGWSGDDPEFIATLNRAKLSRRERLRADVGSLASDAIVALRKLAMDPCVPPSVRLRASLAVLQAATPCRSMRSVRRRRRVSRPGWHGSGFLNRWRVDSSVSFLIPAGSRLPR